MILIGTHHEDVLGPKRLDLILNELKPKVLSIELPSNFSVDIAKTYFRDLKRVNFEAIELSDMGESEKIYFKTIVGAKYYEFFIPLNYSKKNSVEIHFVDYPDKLIDDYDLFRALKIPDVSILKNNYEVMSKHNNLDGLTFEKIMMSYIKIVDKTYNDPEMMKNIFSHLEEMEGELRGFESSDINNDNSFANIRENYMSQKIIELNPDVHIGGIMHMNPELKSIFSVDKPLYEQVASITEKVIKLCDVKLKN